jgi:glycyl-tRNA synthetase
VSGFYDFGPLGCAVKNNIEALWRSHFVLEEDMLEIGCTNLVLSDVLKTSGHVEKFEDLMVKDVKTGTPRRADKIIQEWIKKALPKKKKQEEIDELNQLDQDVENFNEAQIDEVIAKYKIKDPDTGNDFSNAVPFNLMFEAQIGPTGHMKGYLRPETAQGIFINFRRLIEFNNGRMPFAAAQIGLGFRNEISPRQGVLRLREF